MAFGFRGYRSRFRVFAYGLGISIQVVSLGISGWLTLIVEKHTQ